MRERLAVYEGQCKAFTGMVRFTGYEKMYGYYRALLEQIRLDGESDILADHLWFRKGFQGFMRGDIVRFTGRVSRYQRKDGELDFWILHPKNIVRIGHGCLLGGSAESA